MNINKKMKIQSKTSGQKFETRISKLNNKLGSDIRLEVFVADKWRHVNAILIENEIHCSASIYELDAQLKGNLIDWNNDVKEWVKMKNENAAKKQHDFTGDGFNNF